MGKIICISNNKGGCGKTTVAKTLSAALAIKKKKVLLIDGDPQGNTTKGLLKKNVELENSLYDIFNLDKDIDIKDCIYPTIHTNLFILPNEQDTAGLEYPLIIDRKISELSNYLKTQLRTYCLENYDFTIIDTLPGLGVFLASFLEMTDEIISPIDLGSDDSIEGVERVLKLSRTLDSVVKVKIKVLANGNHKGRSAMTANKVLIKNLYGESNIFNTIIPRSAEFQNSESFKPSTVFTRSPTSRASNAFRTLAKEVLKGI